MPPQAARAKNTSETATAKKAEVKSHAWATAQTRVQTRVMRVYFSLLGLWGPSTYGHHNDFGWYCCGWKCDERSMFDVLFVWLCGWCDRPPRSGARSERSEVSAAHGGDGRGGGGGGGLLSG